MSRHILYWWFMFWFTVGIGCWMHLYFKHGDPDYLMGSFVYCVVLIVIIFFYTRRCNPKDPHDWSV